MRIWKTVTATVAVSLVVVGVTAAGVIYSGAYNVAATSEHWPITRWALQTTVHRSVARQAADIDAPQLGSEAQLLAGATNFDTMCSGCHAPPGGRQSVAARSMYPRPPELTHAAEEKSASEIFWVIKHGIKASGMPAWGASHGDEDLWAMTAFVEQLPDMSAADYRQMLQTAKVRGIGHGTREHHDESGASHGGKHSAGEADAHQGEDAHTHG
ncbi:hypothetical protein SADO_07617 [Salinisphaera dokdonensis CL-ES53]|uniref:Cytochrome c domain-containing protein n=1 Tax=Salinisphaera dokdonensis CL-ES53 TaxID=1304272 RepID=A0ABV2AZM8_9GAMM